METGAVSNATADEITMKALGELDSINRGAYIDCSSTTSYTLFLVYQNDRKKRAFTIAQLIDMIDAHHPATT